METFTSRTQMLLLNFHYVLCTKNVVYSEALHYRLTAHMQSLTFFQLYEHCKCNYASDTHGQVHVHAGMPYKFNHYLHACFARNYPEALSHCGHGHDITSVAQLSVINIADIRSAFDKTLASKRFRPRCTIAEKSAKG